MLHGVAIGTIRVVPMDRGLTLAETLLEETAPQARPQHGGMGWEVGRLALAPEYRSDTEALKRCLYLSLDYLSRHADAPELYATCSHVLSRLYRRFGFRAFAHDVLLPGTQKTYTLIHGHSRDVLAALSPRAAAKSAGNPLQ